MSDSATAIKVLIAASGTGGHLLPAVYIAEALTSLAPATSVSFIGSGRPLEEKIVDGRGYHRHVVALPGLRRLGPAGLLRWLTKLPGALWQTWRLLSQEKPALVIGVGGYVSVLPVIVASLGGIPTWIHEAEHQAGWANRLLSYFATGISLAWEKTDIPCQKKAVFTGHPLAPRLLEADFSKASLSSPPHLLVLGGSQGSQSLDDATLAIAPMLAERGVVLRHQCRQQNLDLLSREYAAAGLDATVSPFIEDMAEALAWSDVVLSRAGAGAVRELRLSGRPAILVPLPRSQEQHANAEALNTSGQAAVVAEGAEFTQRLQKVLASALSDDWFQAHNRSAEEKREDAARTIATHLVELMKRASRDPQPAALGSQDPWDQR